MKLTPDRFLEADARGAALEQLLWRRFGGDTAKLPKFLKKYTNLTPEAYFETRGWDQAGIPADQTTSALHITI